MPGEPLQGDGWTDAGIQTEWIDQLLEAINRKLVKLNKWSEREEMPIDLLVYDITNVDIYMSEVDLRRSIPDLIARVGFDVHSKRREKMFRHISIISNRQLVYDLMADSRIFSARW